MVRKPQKDHHEALLDPLGPPDYAGCLPATSVARGRRRLAQRLFTEDDLTVESRFVSDHFLSARTRRNGCAADLCDETPANFFSGRDTRYGRCPQKAPCGGEYGIHPVAARPPWHNGHAVTLIDLFIAIIWITW